jgi:hypothetical protein
VSVHWAVRFLLNLDVTILLKFPSGTGKWMFPIQRRHVWPGDVLLSVAITAILVSESYAAHFTVSRLWESYK